MSKFANFVQCTLVTAITAGATSIEVQAETPFNLPPDPSGQTAFLTLSDNINNPTAFEIIGYTGVIVIDSSSLELTGVTRAQEGTQARSWAEGAFARQDITAGQMGLLEQPFDGVWICSSDTTVRRLTTEGEQVWTNDDHTDEVIRVAVDGSGNSYSLSLAPSGNFKKIDMDGNTVWSENVSTDSGQINRHHVKAGKDGNIYVSNSSSIVKFGPDGTQLWEYVHGFTAGAREFDVDRDGNVFVIEDTLNGQLARVYPDGTLAWQITLTNNKAIALAVSSGINVWISGIDAVFRHDYDGNEISSTPEVGTPNRLQALDDGSVVISKGNSGFRKLDKSGIELWNENNGGSELSAVDASGDVYGPAFVAGRHVKVSGEDGSLVWDKELESLAAINQIAAAEASLGDLIFATGFEFSRRAVRWDDLADKPESITELLFEGRSEPATPPPGKAVVFLDSLDGAFKVKFSTGTVQTIATP